MRLLRIGITFVALVVMIGVIVGYLAGRDDEPPEPDLELPECQEGPTVAGIDVSYYQEKIDWKRVRRAGLRFAFVRISDGTTIADPMFNKNWSGAKRAGIVRGSYQFFRPEESATAQADIVIAALKFDPGELPPAIDVEADGGLRPAELAAKVRVWVDRVRTKLGVEPLIYASPEFWREKLGGADIPQPLWLAHYTQKCPTVPAPWTRWTFWQHSKSGSVPGIYGPVDLDVFAGTLDELRAGGTETARR